ncbi:MAG: site-specific DNA-methyltransferase [Candidatus Dadabacteria bacterium]|nr:site-specific DNA-methyltransferase [Candidatus Dadabacteria bacterium]
MPVSEFIDTIKRGNCVELMQTMPGECVDLIVTDPPFAIDFKASRANYNRKESRVIEGYNEIKGNDYQTFTLNWLSQASRVLKQSGSMYVFSGWNHLKEILIAIDECGLTTINHLIWKYQFGVTTKRKYVTSHYHCLFLCKDDSKRRFYPFSRFGKEEKTANGGSAHYKDKEDVWDIKREYWQGDKKTPTKLPAEIIEKILDYSSKEGDLVLDPFLGSGQVAVVSKMRNRRYAGFEIVREYYEFALERLNSGNYRVKDDNEEDFDEERVGLFAL